MITIIDEFSNSLYTYCAKSGKYSYNGDSMILDEQRLKPIQERWREKRSKRGHGYYTKSPDEPVFTDLVSSLLASRINVNAHLKLPSLSPNWLSIAIGLILSTGNNGPHSPYFSSSSNVTPLVQAISTFVDDWLNIAGKSSCSTAVTFPLPTNVPIELSEQNTFILEQILIPLLPCHMLVHKVYTCKDCQYTVRMCATITSVPVNVLRSGLNLEHQLPAFFSSNLSDLLCLSCNQPTVRHIEVIRWPQILIININHCKKMLNSANLQAFFHSVNSQVGLL